MSAVKCWDSLQKKAATLFCGKGCDNLDSSAVLECAPDRAMCAHTHTRNMRLAHSMTLCEAVCSILHSSLAKVQMLSVCIVSACGRSSASDVETRASTYVRTYGHLPTFTKHSQPMCMCGNLHHKCMLKLHSTYVHKLSHKPS